MLTKCVLVLALAAVCTAQMSAVAYVSAVSGVAPATWGGWVMFQQATATDPVTVTAMITTTAPDGWYGMHVHSWGDVTSASGAFLGTHYNPNGGYHSCPPNATRHEGDMGNITVTNGVGTYSATLDLLTLTGANSIVGRGLVIHNVTDTCADNWAGIKAAQGVIGIMNMANNMAAAGPTAVTTTGIASIIPTGANTNSLNTLSGMVQAYQTQAGSARLSLTMSGLIPLKVYSWHVHAWGDMNNTLGFGMGAGGHFNPGASNYHGFMDMPMDVHHGGDLGNFTTDNMGNAAVEIDVMALNLTAGPNSIIGRMIIIHNQTDVGPANNGSTGNGNAGARIGFGVIGLSSMAVNPNTYPVEVGKVWMAPTPDQFMMGMAYFGSVTFTRMGPMINLNGMISGFEANSVHAIHVHQWGDISSNTSTGAHYNPLNMPHGFPDQMPHHMGDLGNFTADANGVINIMWNVSYMDLAGWSSIIGRSLVVHSAPDNGAASQPTGNSGNRICAGVIGIASMANNRAFAQPMLGKINGSAMVIDNDLVLGAVLLNTTVATGGIAGWVWLYYDTTYQAGVNMNIASMISGPGIAPSANHGWHIHAWGDITDRSATAAGAHYNPYNVSHDLPANLPRHQGDLGNVMADANSVIATGMPALGPYNVAPLTFVNNVVGRAFMLHAAPDQGATGGPTGGAGARIAVGVLGIAAPMHPMMPPPPPMAPPMPPPEAPAPPPMPSTTANGASALSVSLAIIVALVAALLL